MSDNKITSVGCVGNMLKLINKLKQYHFNMILSVLSGMGHHLSNISTVCICAYMVGLATQGLLLDKLSVLITLLIVVIILRAVLYYSEMWFSHKVAFCILADFRIMLFNAVDRVSPAILLNMRSGQLASTLMSDVELLEWFFAHTFGTIIVAFVVPVITLLFMGYLHWVLPIVMIVFLVIVITIPFIMKKKADQQGIVVREALADANSVALEGLHGLKEILTLNYSKSYQQKNRKYMDKLYDGQIKYGKRLGTEGGLMQIVIGMAMISIMSVAIFLVFNGQLDFKWFPVVIILAAMTFNPVMNICNMARNFGLIVAASNRVFAVLESKPLVEDAGKDMDISNIVPSVEFDHVSFAYREDLSNAIKDVSFKVKEGQTVAIVGHSGAGKTTCINLLLRYWDASSGAIKIGGTDIRDMSLKTLRHLTSAVLQEVYLFNTSIKENIRLGRLDATDDEVINAAKLALAHDFIVEFPKGYDTIAGERGVQLSGGQRQRIAIARAILSNAPILILDEAVSSLDSENENAIQYSLKNRNKRQTILVVAHRLSTIMNADYLIVMKDGQVVETGHHEELILQDGYYSKLISAQQHHI